MAKPCEICGHTGFIGCMRVCCRCKITREHPYCMRIIHEGNPDSWVCDDCVSGAQMPSPKTVPIRDPCNTAIRSNIRKPPRNTKVQYISPEEAKVLESGAQKKNFSSPRKLNLSCRPTVNRTFQPRMESDRSTIVSSKFSLKQNSLDRPPGFTKPLGARSPPNTSWDKILSKDTEKHVANKQLDRPNSPMGIKLSAKKAQTSNVATAEKNKGPARQVCRDTSTSMPLHIESVPKSNGERVVEKAGRASMQSVQHVSAKSSEKGPVRQLQSGQTSLQLVQNPHAVKSDKAPDRKLNMDSGMTMHLEKISESHSEIVIGTSENASVPSVNHLPATSSGVAVHVDSQRENVGSGGRESLGVVFELDRYLLNHPAEFPTWKGRFKVTQDDDVLRCRSFDGVQAHPPCKVHRKVYNLSKQLPETLHFELLPRLNFWGDLFEDDAPCALDIGLYFQSPKSISLLKFLDDNDKLLRCQIDCVELFVFSSRHLPEDSQKINKKLFLWGIFRSSEDDMESSRGQSCEDMEIDMAGGCEVGTIDKVVPKPSKDTTPVTTVPALTPIKIEGLDSTEPVCPLTSSYHPDQLEFEKELQRSFDRFVMLEQPQVRVKEEVEIPRRT
ncbi:hypothetical protein vseg_013773 [Gypsophila vaccaria]